MAISVVQNNSVAEGVTLTELLEAYYSCRRHKRNTHNALKFEVDFERHLILLRDEINAGTYRPGRSIAFVVDKPVKEKSLLLILEIESCII